MSDSVFDPNSDIGRQLAEAAKNARFISFSGLPGVGKSTFLQQQIQFAARAGREIHLLQWDLARAPFETPEALKQYPEIAGFTHPAIIKVVGLWARRGIAAWHQQYRDDKHVLIAEIPIVGGRLVELAQTIDDPAEALFSGPDSRFMVPVPSATVRQAIESARIASIEQPRNDKEMRDAPINVVHEHWQATYQIAVDRGWASPAKQPEYDPVIYQQVFLNILRHRPTKALTMNAILNVTGSVYDSHESVKDLQASPAEVADAYATLRANYTDASLSQAIARWYDV